ncbi:MAG: aminotransferase class V-fold PLP-dependent enzyme [Treponema sp.]|jgi:cysteine desulfurase|nr:aminotransferase class V-fold PLP-dependent enzyme [Treponema sp.]
MAHITPLARAISIRYDPPMERYYFDWAATARPDITIEHRTSLPFANPSSIHKEGKAAHTTLEEARTRCAGALGINAEEIYFTSGGTESNGIVLFSLLCKPGILQNTGKSAVLLYSVTEHPSIRENSPVLKQMGVRCAPIPAEKDGRISALTLQRTLAKNPGARMIMIMAVNNETGAINDIKALTELIRKHETKGPPVHFHCDAVQAAGKIPLDMYGWRIDSASLSAHKIGGSRSTGLLWLKTPITPLVRGGGQEKKNPARNGKHRWGCGFGQCP